MRTVLSIAGSDSGGGAGVQADVKTLTMHGVYATCAITALTAQNTMGVYDVFEVTPRFLREQIDAVFEDIPPGAVKIGMVSAKELIETIAERLRHYGAENVVVDPVTVSTSGTSLLKPDALISLREELLPLATLATPNIPEAEILAETIISSPGDMECAAEKIANRFGCAVLVKGGHGNGDPNDFLYDAGKGEWFFGERIQTENTHGTGCTLSSAIAANLAKGYPLAQAVERAKDYLSGALRAGLCLGKGCGPLHHMFDLKSKYAEER